MKPSTRADVTFCSVERVGRQTFLVLCTTLAWQVYRLDKFSGGRETLTPVQIAIDDSQDGALLSNVRILRLFQLLPDQEKEKPARLTAINTSIGGLFVSERCQEVDYSHTSASSTTDSSDDEAQGSEDITIFSFASERILKRLPPTTSTVVDVQIQRSTAAILCESHEIMLLNLRTLTVDQRIPSLSSLAMALGPRWIAYPGFSPPEDEDSDGDDSIDMIPEALVSGGSRQMLQSQSGSMSSTSPSYTAIDVAQNVASGLYYFSKTIAPYLSSSPSTSTSTTTSTTTSTQVLSSTPPTATQKGTFASTTSPHAGWVVVQDLRTGRVLANFKSHSTALVNLAFDPSGSLLATSSMKGQNVHVYRLLPPLQTQRRRGHGVERQQLLYKLQRGITHASIADISFSQDSKWISVTSAHGTSHMYAIHPEGSHLSAETHATKQVDDGAELLHARGRQVRDFCAPFRPFETQTVTRVLKIHHELHSNVAVASASASLGLGASSVMFNNNSPPGGVLAYAGTALVGTALDASQALLTQLAQSTTNNLPRVDLGVEDQSLSARRQRRRRRMSFLFAVDGLKVLICCDGNLKLYDLSAQTSHNDRKGSRATASSSGGSTSSLSSKTRPTLFGVNVTISELKTWDLLEGPRVRTESLSPGEAVRESASSPTLNSRSRIEMRSFRQQGLPLWAHPKVAFRVQDLENPEGALVQVKRKGPSQDTATDGGDEQQLFVMEMDSYFGLGGSPVFTGQPDHRVSPQAPPPLDLTESINLAMSTRVPTPESMASPAEPLGFKLATPVNVPNSKNAKKKAKKKTGRTSPSDSDSSGDSSSSISTTVSSSPSMLQFTLQDMYFVPKDEE
ncbi:hypothetical protein Poli38472_012479 [Pythium oligandrum]|uniref:BCAS3 WD40 domain-containing protein n=1 Tax=Pythium oligandrum TaxID=41045 RepID=A0A8K1FR92_PYTOL|nr:hypothetical protein Poli38472_012479 [Pythium oligandrum]|eukprot:TMW67363.1 hypothetical protein Poli38472_012479 [Pythium oligandrum]